MATRNLLVSLIQANIIWENAQANRDNFATLLALLKGHTHIAILPEMFTTGFSMNPVRFAEAANGPTLLWMKEMAHQLGIALCGSIMVMEHNLYYNRFYFVTPVGAHFHYNKRHLFRLMSEHLHYQMGTERVIINYLGWRIMPQICYDLRFPVWSRNRNDYDLLLYVANFPSAREGAWNKLLPARAIENCCYVAAVNRLGADGYGVNFSGDSQVIDPRGNVLLAAESNKEAVVTTNLSLSELNEYRAKFPAHLDADSFNIEL